MRVVQSALGRFHHFDLARQMHERAALECLFTGYPRWKLKAEGLPAEKLRTFPWLQAAFMARGRVGLTQRWLERELAWRCHLSHDWYVSNNVGECDVFIGMSGISLRSGQVVQRRGGRYICDRGSAHIVAHDRLVAEEYRRRKVEYRGTDSRDRAREEAEYALADLITVPSRFSARTFVEQGVPETKLRRIIYGMDLQRFKRSGEPVAGTFEVLFVGNVSLLKGIFYLLEAFAKVKHPRKHLRLVGSISQDFKKAFSGSLPTDVTLLGPLPQIELPALMSRSHILVLPSISDGFGLVLGQALACGCPILASDHTGAPDLIKNGDEGFIVPAADSGALAERLEQLCQDSALYPQMSLAARHRAQNLGGWNQYGTEMHALCRTLVENS